MHVYCSGSVGTNIMSEEKEYTSILREKKKVTAKGVAEARVRVVFKCKRVRTFFFCCIGHAGRCIIIIILSDIKSVTGGWGGGMGGENQLPFANDTTLNGSRLQTETSGFSNRVFGERERV